MRFLKRLICLTVVVFAISSILSGVYIFRPDIIDQIETFLDSGKKNDETVIGNHGRQEETASHTDESAEREETRREAEDYETDEKGPLENDVIAESVVSDYVLPNQSEIVVPENVSGRNGYQQIQENREPIDDEAAEELQDQIDTGYMGDGLDFDSVRYPYYAMLDDRGKHIYRQIYANADAMTKQFSPVENITSGDLKNAFTAVVNDHPELFWVETAYKYRHSPAGQVAEITLAYNITAGNLDKAKSDFQAAAKEITDTVYGIYTAYDREKKIHDELISRVKYDTNAPMNQSAYSALVYGRTVCAGYARALQYLLQQFDIPCYYVTGYAGENHAWNIVKLDDGYYNVDSTWDDTNPNTYDYFNCSDDEYAKDHARRDLSVYLPPCKGNRYSGLEVNPPAQQPSKPTTTPPTSAPSTSTPSTPPSTTTPSTTPSGSTSSSATVPSTAPSGTTGRGSITVRTTRNGSDAGYIDNIEDYYIACFEAMMAQDGSSATFDVLISDEDLWKDIYNEYQNGKCQDGYMERFLVEKHKNNCTVSVEAYLRNDGSCLIRHYATIN